MSRTYNVPPGVLRSKIRSWGRAIGDETRMLISRPWLAFKMGFEAMLRSDNPQPAARDDRARDDRLPQFFGLGSITQELLDKAERERRSTIPPDPFARPAAPSGEGVDHAKAAAPPRVKKFHACRQPEA